MQAEKRSIKTDYLNQAEPLRSFYKYPVSGSPDFEQIIKDKQKETISRQCLFEVLQEQYLEFSAGTETLRNIQLLKEENTFTITTGHQIVLFGGPMFTFYKVLNIISLAEDLAKRHPDYNFVPVFWIHTEDHDFEEVNHYYASYEKKVVYPAPFKGAVGNHVLETGIRDQVPDHFPVSLKATYHPGRKMGCAYLSFMNELFGKYGLVILDADHPKLKKHFKAVMHAEMSEQAVQAKVWESSEGLANAGYKVQISAREINFFYHDRNIRSRIIPADEGFAVVDSELRFSKEEMAQLIEDHPERFSPNVSLRPLYQEMILPNLAYYGGWGELSYWMQLKGVFDHFGVNFPLVLPRFSATIFRESEWKDWKGMGFEPEDIQSGLPELFRKYMPEVWQDGHYQQIGEKFDDLWDELSDYVHTIMPTMSRSVEGQKVKVNHFMGNTLNKIHKVIRSKHPEAFAKIESLKKQIQPDGLVQERVLGIGAFDDIQPADLINRIWEEMVPISLHHRYIKL